MSTVEKAIMSRYGVRIGPSAADGKYRSFKIDQFRNGFIVKFPDCACFGSQIDGELFVWVGGALREVVMDSRNDNEQITLEWMIWRIARATVERGEKLSKVDNARLALAVQRLEAWL